MANTNDILAAIQIAATDASARIQAALGASSNQAQAERDVASTRSAADIQVAEIDANARVQAAQIDSQWHAQVAQIDSSWHAQVAQIEASAQVTSAQTAASAEVSAASAHATATVSAANSQANATIMAASTDAAARESVAATEASAQTTVASTNASAQVQAEQLRAAATSTAATTAANAQIQSATIDASWHSSVATIGANATVQAASIDAGWHANVATIESSATRYKADQDLAGVNVHETAETYRLNLKLGFANDKFTVLLPVIQEAIGTVAGASGGGSIGFGAYADRGAMTMGFGSMIHASGSPTSSAPSSGEMQMGTFWRRPLSMGEYMSSGDIKSGGIGFSTGSSVADAVAATQLPFINTNGVLTKAQILQQVNEAFARNDAKTNSETLRLTEEMAGRGFSANSPILSALRVGLTGQNLRASVLAEQQIRLEAAKLNAEQILQAQGKLSDQFIAQENVLLDHEKNTVTRTVGIISAISQLVGSAL